MPKEGLNPAYSAWVRTDQSVRSWLNATLSVDMLTEVYNITYMDVWMALEQRFVDQSTKKK